MTRRQDLLAQWRHEHRRPVRGWDLSELGDRYLEQRPPWSYPELASRALRGAGSALDLGTGGGELLLSLGDALPGDTVATEGWPPNIPVARENLAARGIPVVPYDAETDPRLPFPDRRFDVVLDRHEAYVAREVYRVLRPGGRFAGRRPSPTWPRWCGSSPTCPGRSPTTSTSTGTPPSSGPCTSRERRCASPSAASTCR